MPPGNGWWRTDATGAVVLTVHYGAKPIEFERGKAAIAVGKKNKLIPTIETVIAAVEVGELDGVLARMSTTAVMTKGKRALIPIVPKTLALRNCKPLSGYKPAELSANKILGPRHAVGRRDTECPPASRRGEVAHHRVVGVAPAASPPVALARIPERGAKPTGRRSGRDCCSANSGRCERGNHQFAHHKSSPCTLRVQTNHGLA